MGKENNRGKSGGEGSQEREKSSFNNSNQVIFIAALIVPWALNVWLKSPQKKGFDISLFFILLKQNAENGPYKAQSEPCQNCCRGAAKFISSGFQPLAEAVKKKSDDFRFPCQNKGRDDS